RDEEPVPIPQLNPAVPSPLVGLVRRMMAKKAEQRFATAAEVQEQLLAWASGDVVLPLDQRGNKEYQEAVAALRTTEAPPELIEEVIPVGIPVSTKRKRRRLCARVSTNPLKSSGEETAAVFKERMLLIGLGVLFFLTVGLAGVLAFVLAR